MKRIVPAFFTIIIIMGLIVGMAYAVDHTRMQAGEPVVFFTWGRDYTPSVSGTAVTGELSDPEPPKEPPKKEVPAQAEVTLYFPDFNIMNLHSEKRLVTTNGNLEKAVVEAVIAGPESDEHLPSVTDDVKVISASVPQGGTTCIVDLSKEFILNNTGGSTVETFALYSIVNSLCSLPDITEVKINIDGDEDAVFGGHYDISTPIEPDMTLIK